MARTRLGIRAWIIVALGIALAACGGDEEEAATVAGSNHAPTIKGSPATTINQGSAYSFAPTAADADGDALIFGIDAKPAWASFNTSSGLLSGTPTPTDVGMHRGIVVWVSDGKSQTLLPAFDVQVMAPPSSNNRPPTISGTPATSIIVGASYTFTPTASDPDGQTLTFTIRNRPAWAVFDAATGRLQGSPPSAGTFADIAISVSDGQVAVPLPAFTILVTPPPVNRPPVISGVPMTSVAAGVAYTFVPTASDPDGDTLLFSIAGQPSWAAFDTRTGRLSGTAPSATGTFSNIRISVSDGPNTASLAAFSITVTAPTTNRPPTISGTPPTTATQGTLYSFTPTAGDQDGDALTFSIANRPVWATFNPTNGTLQGTPGASNIRTYSNIVISVSDGTASTPLPEFSIAVTSSNIPPTISGTPPTTATVGTLYSFTPTASDPDGGTLTFSITNKPSWATFSTTTGRLQGTPATANVGTFASIGISVSDGQDSAPLAAFSIVVSAAPNQPPTITGVPPTSVTAGTAYAFQPTASDPDGGTLTFSITNKPSWATFSTTTGRLQGTPATGNVGTFSSIGISVSDGQGGSAQLATFAIVVSAAANRPPTITGVPPTSITVGTAYSFTPTSSDPDGDALTFTVANLPSWASFDTATGRVSGTPAAQHVGTFVGIVITANDGRLGTASLAAFNLTVQAVAVGSATISWLPPTTNTDGSALTNLAGYKVYWGLSQGNYPNSTTLANPGLTSYVVSNLSPGTYYFVATAYNTAGVESSFSGVASKTIQ